MLGTFRNWGFRILSSFEFRASNLRPVSFSQPLKPHFLILLLPFSIHKATGMSLVIDLHQFPYAEMGISLGGREAGMAQHLLDLPDISPRIQKVRCKTVTKAMGADPSKDA